MPKNTTPVRICRNTGAVGVSAISISNLFAPAARSTARQAKTCYLNSLGSGILMVVGLDPSPLPKV